MSRRLTAASQYEQAEHGKTELSLVQFSVINTMFSKNIYRFNSGGCDRTCFLLQFTGSIVTCTH